MQLRHYFGDQRLVLVRLSRLHRPHLHDECETPAPRKTSHSRTDGMEQPAWPAPPANRPRTIAASIAIERSSSTRFGSCVSSRDAIGTRIFRNGQENASLTENVSVVDTTLDIGSFVNSCGDGQGYEPPNHRLQTRNNLV